MSPIRAVAPHLITALLVSCARSHEVDSPARDPADDRSVAGPAPAASSGSLCTRFAAIQCEGEQRCCATTLRTREQCQLELAQTCEETTYLDAIAANPETGFDEDSSERIFTELAQRTARCDLTLLAWAASPQGLRGLFRGTRTAGASCTSPGGVSGPRATVATSLATCRVDDALACLPSSLLGEWTCVPKQTPGQPCLTDDNCQPNSACDNFSEPALGSCVERLPLGAACEYAGECQSLHCAEGSCAEPDAAAVYCPTA